MKITPECIPCLLKRIIFEAEHSTKNPETKKKVIKNTCRMLSELYDPSKSSASIATEVHKQVYKILNDKDPYKKLKEKANTVAKKLIPRVEELMKNSDDPLKTIMICSIIGNMMDFGIAGASRDPEMLAEIFEQTYKQGLGYDDYDKVKKMLSRSKNVLLFTDNCGEIVFDKILCQEIKKQYPQIHLTVVVKGEPIISDATMEDIVELNFKDIVDCILTTGCFYIGVNPNDIPEDLQKAIKNADLIICKGMANYEALSETSIRPIAYLLRTKCNAIANSMNIPVNVNAIKLYT